MRLISALLCAAGLCAQPSLRIVPEVATVCRDGYAQVRLIWDSGGPDGVTIVADANPVSGAEPARGELETGWWVSDGMQFTLIDANRTRLAIARASVRCGAPIYPPGVSWWPLEVGNEWHFRLDSRNVTGAHEVWRVARTEQTGGKTWAVIDTGYLDYRWLREDEQGRIWRLDREGREELLFDPTPANAGLWRASSNVSLATTPAGVFVHAVNWGRPAVSLGLESGQLIRGLGPSRFITNVLAGSSGGFGSGLEILQARIGPARYGPQYPALELQLESQLADVTNRKARNCAVPCYFVACGLVAATDPPGTYKPCLEASISQPGELRLLDASGQIRHRATLNEPGFARIPLWELPLGSYRIEAETQTGFRASAPLTIR